MGVGRWQGKGGSNIRQQHHHAVCVWVGKGSSSKKMKACAAEEAAITMRARYWVMALSRHGAWKSQQHGVKARQQQQQQQRHHTQSAGGSWQQAGKAGGREDERWRVSFPFLFLLLPSRGESSSSSSRPSFFSFFLPSAVSASFLPSQIHGCILNETADLLSITD